MGRTTHEVCVPLPLHPLPSRCFFAHSERQNPLFTCLILHEPNLFTFRRLEQVLNVHPEKYGGQRSCYTRPPTLRNSPEDDRDKPRSHSEDFSLWVISFCKLKSSTPTAIIDLSSIFFKEIVKFLTTSSLKFHYRVESTFLINPNCQLFALSYQSLYHDSWFISIQSAIEFRPQIQFESAVSFIPFH